MSKKEEYNAIPILFCKRCLSLAIKAYNDTIDYCDDCGATSVMEAHVNDWNNLYIQKYGEPYLKRE